MSKLQILKKTKVKDLIKELQKYPQNKTLFLSVDEEQNAIADMIGIEHYVDCIVLLPLNPVNDHD